MGAYISVPTWWRQLDQRYRLVLGRCPNCGTHNFPPEGACRSCNKLVDFEEVTPEGTGIIVAHTVIEGAAPPEFTKFEKQHGPIGVAVVELDEGVRIPGMLADCDPGDLGRGDRVEKTVRRIYEHEGVIRYGYKFTPVDN
jgi:uncharacterized OB-fold protein